ncbi:hypothetical protein BDP27DRAFT_1434860 [Rhodocollybia butyracea]|uniref:Uncharacterized protein n=1 Tax=Rhodocollybia butyracea TaxID=206335 RepID=A0A9P5P2D1_9AGAR|nr:hypothetical protein BDP27DRAFT_1434860 [Rhodocollybia butyracea]
MPLQRREPYVKVQTSDPDLEAQRDAVAEKDPQASASPTSTIVKLDVPILQDLKEMQIAHALALKVRNKLFSDINSLTWHMLIITVSCITCVLGLVYLIEGDIRYGIKQRQNARNISSLNDTNPSVNIQNSNPKDVYRQIATWYLQTYTLFIVYDVLCIFLARLGSIRSVSVSLRTGMTLLDKYIGDSIYHYHGPPLPSPPPSSSNKYTQNTWPTRPDPDSWSSKTGLCTHYLCGGESMALYRSILMTNLLMLFPFDLMVRVYAGGMHPGSYTLYVLGLPVLAFLALSLVCFLAISGLFGFQIVPDGRVEEYSEEIWMAMAMDSKKLGGHIDNAL